jgi:predicted Zn-dependent protease with MMP-like domain
MKPDPVSNSENNCLLYYYVSNTLQKRASETATETPDAIALMNGYVVDYLYEDIASGMNSK